MPPALDTPAEASYNGPYFTAHEDTFRVLKMKLGTCDALEIFAAVLESALGRAFDQMIYRRGNVEDLVRVIQARDASLGLNVRFPMVSDHT